MAPVAAGPPGTGGPARPVPSAPLPSTGAVLSRAGSENFPVATRLLPARVRSHLLALYGYARFVDDIGDEPAEDPDQRLAKLDRVDADLDRLYRDILPELAPVRSLRGTVVSCGIPRGPLARLVEANRRDQRQVRYPSFESLVEYCTFSADPVGEMVLMVFGAATPDRVALSNRICTGLQVLEHCQDVGEDFRRGRVYLPQADLAEAGACEADLSAATTSPALRGAVRRQVDRAVDLLDEGAALVGTLHGLGRVAVAGYVGGGRATAAALRRAGHDVLAADIRPGKGRLLAEWARLAATGGRR